MRPSRTVWSIASISASVASCSGSTCGVSLPHGRSSSIASSRRTDRSGGSTSTCPGSPSTRRIPCAADAALIPPRPFPILRPRGGVGAEGRARGIVRIVVDLGDVAGYRVQRSARGRELLLAVASPPRDVPRAEPPARVATRAGEPHRPKVVIDPGHGGHDPGAQGYAVEKDVTLAIAKHLAVLLGEQLGAEVVLTRSADATLPLAARTARANAEGADLFVSIHANASPRPRLHGVETYYLNNTHDRGTIRLAALENGLSLPTPARGGADLRYIVSDLVQAAKMEESIALATAVQRGLVDHLGARYGGVTDLGVKRGPFYVLVGAYMPCVLVETSFLTNPTEGRRLAARAYRDAVAEGIYAGIARFLADARRARTL